jgi:hypothetical protein
VLVTDSYGAAVADATLQGPQGTAKTNAQGVALVPMPSPDSTAVVVLSRETFVDTTVTLTSASGRVEEVAVTLPRVTLPAGGSLRSRSGFAPSLDASGRELTFEIELVVVQGNSQPVETLTQGNFALQVCTPAPASVRNGRADCLLGAGSTDADVAYTPVNPSPSDLNRVPGVTPQPYAAALLLDQSGSIASADPTNARLYSSKAFLDGLGVDDQAMLAAFAGGAESALPTSPLAIYGGFLDKAGARALFAVLDSLALLVGGHTPLYGAIDGLRQRVADDVTLPVGLARALLVFTDGADTTCLGVEACRRARETTIQSALQAQVRVFTVGLSKGIDVAALGELADRTGGAFLYADNAPQFLALYGSVGRLMSLSLPTYRLRWTVQAAANDKFRSGDTLLGKVQVTAAGGQFDVPFVVAIL